MIIFIFITDEDEICNNPNFHSEEQDELEIPDGKIYHVKNFFFIELWITIFFYDNNSLYI